MHRAVMKIALKIQKRSIPLKPINPKPTSMKIKKIWLIFAQQILRIHISNEMFQTLF